MNISCGEYRIEYYSDDKRLINTESAISLGDAKQKADINCNDPSISASSYVVMRCVMLSEDGVERW